MTGTFRLLAATVLALAIGAVAITYGDEDATPKSAPTPSGETWTDPTTGLTWQVAPSGGRMKWSEAKAYCQNMSGGHGGWRLPTISELRTLLRGCPATKKGGYCDVADNCLEWKRCGSDASCNGCSLKDGPAPGGAYWPRQLGGVVGAYWSSSPVADINYGAWAVGFEYGHIFSNVFGKYNEARCVR